MMCFSSSGSIDVLLLQPTEQADEPLAQHDCAFTFAIHNHTRHVHSTDLNFIF